MTLGEVSVRVRACLEAFRFLVVLPVFKIGETE